MPAVLTFLAHLPDCSGGGGSGGDGGAGATGQGRRPGDRGGLRRQRRRRRREGPGEWAQLERNATKGGCVDGGVPKGQRESPPT